MAETEYHQNLIDMQHCIHKLNEHIHNIKKEKIGLNDLPEKTDIYPLLQTLEGYNYMYNKDPEKYSFTIGVEGDGLKDIILEDYEVFEKIIKKIDKNESVFLKDIYAAKRINYMWLESVSKQRKKLYACLEKAAK